MLHTLLNDDSQRTVVRVISFAGDSPALTTGPRLALHAAASGTTTALVPEDPELPDDRSLVTLRAAFTGAEPVGPGLPFTVGPHDIGDDLPSSLSPWSSSMASRRRSPLRHDQSVVDLFGLRPRLIELAHLALEAADGGSALDGVVVVNPDPSDTTSGLIATDALRLSLLMHRGTELATSWCDCRHCRLRWRRPNDFPVGNADGRDHV